MSDVDRLRQDAILLEQRWQAAVVERDAANRNLSLANLEVRALNEEIADRNRELGQLSNELEGLLNGTSIPLVMVDRNLAIRHMTPAAQQSFNVRPEDVGRPIADIPSRLDDCDLESLVRRVIDTGSAEETEFLDSHRRWCSLRAQPYRAGRSIEGATLTLVDIDGSRRHKVAQAIVESAPVPLVVLNNRLRVTVVSRDFLAVYGLRKGEVENRAVDELGAPPLGLPEFKLALARLSAGESESEEIECTQRIPELGERVILIDARRVSHGEDDRFVIAIHDITAQKRADGIMARALHESEDALRLSREELRALTGRLLDAQDEERRRVSRELHDGLSQSVASLQFDVEALEKTLPRGLETEKRKLMETRDAIEQLSNELRRIAYGLHPLTLDALGLAAALSAYVREFSQRTGIMADFAAAGVPPEIPPSIAGSFYRITQEALRNLARHAPKSRAWIRLTGENSVLTLSIRDNGPGFDREAVRGRGGLGLVSMEERARLIRGCFQVETEPGRGVSITVSAPID